MIREEINETKNYCEENIYQLCEKLEGAVGRAFVVVVSNEEKKVPLWCQRTCKDSDDVVLWDYHVILLVEGDESNSSLIYDFDTTLPWPCNFKHYVEHSFRPGSIFNLSFNQIFRVIPAVDFLNFFASDRSHMIDSDGSWIATPPTYPPIQGLAAPDCNTLPQLICMHDEDSIPGNVLDLSGFMLRFY